MEELSSDAPNLPLEAEGADDVRSLEETPPMEEQGRAQTGPRSGTLFRRTMRKITSGLDDLDRWLSEELDTGTPGIDSQQREPKHLGFKLVVLAPNGESFMHVGGEFESSESLRTLCDLHLKQIRALYAVKSTVASGQNVQQSIREHLSCLEQGTEWTSLVDMLAPSLGVAADRQSWPAPAVPLQGGMTASQSTPGQNVDTQAAQSSGHRRQAQSQPAPASTDTRISALWLGLARKGCITAKSKWTGVKWEDTCATGPNGRYTRCRVDDGNSVCNLGGRCAAIRAELGWPAELPCIDSGTQSSSMEICQGLCRFYVAKGCLEQAEYEALMLESQRPKRVRRLSVRSTLPRTSSTPVQEEETGVGQSGRRSAPPTARADVSTARESMPQSIPLRTLAIARDAPQVTARARAAPELTARPQSPQLPGALLGDTSSEAASPVPPGFSHIAAGEAADVMDFAFPLVPTSVWTPTPPRGPSSAGLGGRLPAGDFLAPASAPQAAPQPGRRLNNFPLRNTQHPFHGCFFGARVDNAPHINSSNPTSSNAMHEFAALASTPEGLQQLGVFSRTAQGLPAAPASPALQGASPLQGTSDHLQAGAAEG